MNLGLPWALVTVVFPAAGSPVAASSEPNPLLAIEGVYREYHAFVWRNARRLGCGDDVVDDVVHEVFLIAQRKLREFEGRAQLSTWLFSVTHHVVQHFRRTRARETRRVERYAEGQEGGPGGQPHAETRRTLIELLSRLDEPRRLVFILVELEGMTSAEAAAALRIPQGTVDSRLRSARQSLTKAIEQERARERGRGP